MKTLHFKNKEFEAEIIIKGDDYIKGVNLEGFQVFLFDGISDFSYFTLSPDEEWDAPIEPEKINATNIKLDPITGLSAETVHQGIEKLVNNIKSTVKTVNSIIPDEQGNVNIPNATKTAKGLMQVGEGLSVSNGVVNLDKSATSKQFLSLGNGSVNLSLGTAPFDIKLATTYLSNGIPYDASTGNFTLTKGKTYKIQFVANLNTTGRIEIRAVTSVGANVNSMYGLWSSVAEDKSPNMYSVIIQPSTTADYKLRVTVHSVETSTLSQYTGHLEIIEI